MNPTPATSMDSAVCRSSRNCDLADVNALITRLTNPANEHATWPTVAQIAQQRFAAGLDALHAAGVLHAFDEHQRGYIAGYGSAPTLLVQGPPGTGKSYSTAFALLARLQAHGSRAPISRPTDLQNPCRPLMRYWRKCRECRNCWPSCVCVNGSCSTSILMRGSYVPLYRVAPRTNPPLEARWHALARDADVQGVLSSHTYAIAAITPFATIGPARAKAKYSIVCPSVIAWCSMRPHR